MNGTFKASTLITLGVMLAAVPLYGGVASAAPITSEPSTSGYSVKVLESPKKIAMGSAGRLNCGKPLKVRVRGSLSEGESLTLRTELTVRNGEQQGNNPRFTHDVKIRKVTKIFPEKSGVDICSFVAGHLKEPGTYRVDLKVTAVVRNHSIAVDAAHSTVSLVAEYSGYAE